MSTLTLRTLQHAVDHRVCIGTGSFCTATPGFRRAEGYRNHNLIATLLVFWAWWMDRRWLPVFIVGRLAVMAGRLAIGANHPLDLLESLVFAAIGFAVASVVRFPSLWSERTERPRPCQEV